MFIADDDADFAQTRDAHADREGPVTLLAHFDFSVSRGRDKRHQVLHRNMRSFQFYRLSSRILQDKAVGLQVAVLLQNADPILFAAFGHLNQLFRQIPAIKQEHAEAQSMSNRRFDQLDAQLDLGAKLLMQRYKLRVLEQNGIDFAMQPVPFLLLAGDLPFWEVLVDKLFPAGQLFVTSIHAQVDWKTHWAAHIVAGDGIMGQRITVIAVIVVTCHIIEQAADMFAQGVIQDECRALLALADRFRLFQQIMDAALVDLLFKPGRFRKVAGEIRLIGALQNTASHVGHALVGQHHEPGQVILEMLKLTTVLKEIPKCPGMSRNYGSRSHNWKLHGFHPPQDVLERAKRIMTDLNCQSTTVE